MTRDSRQRGATAAAKPTHLPQSRRHVATDEAASKLLWLAIRNATKTTVRSAHAWHEAMNQFAIFFGERFTHPQR
jgi:transposase-like protein